MRGPVERLARRRGLDRAVGEDILQEAAMRLWIVVCVGEVPDRPAAWLLLAARRLVADALRGRAPSVGAGRRKGAVPAPLDPEAIAAPGLDPSEAAILAEVRARAPALFARLPPPYRQIAHLQYLGGWSRARITTWLATWRPVSREGARKRFRQTHQRLRALGRGERRRDPWPGRFSKKNGWFGTPPPNSASSRVEAVRFRVLRWTEGGGRPRIDSSRRLRGVQRMLGKTMSAIQVSTALIVIGLAAAVAFAAGAGDCYRTVVKDNNNGNIYDLGCPTFVDCDTDPNRQVPCVENHFVSYQFDPVKRKYFWADCAECLCGGAPSTKPCNLYSYGYSGGGLGWACRTRNCASPKDCELPNPLWKPFCVDSNGDGNYDCDPEVSMMGDCQCK